ncbi:MAG TPA: hypothetical protein VFA27_16095 [Vicinamibacterales bacterium]|nr:hypothetical protein [Vicinamibacterales bacterium]
MIAAYVVAISAALFSGCAALTLINTFRHFDPPQPAEKPAPAHVTV